MYNWKDKMEEDYRILLTKGQIVSESEKLKWEDDWKNNKLTSQYIENEKLKAELKEMKLCKICLYGDFVKQCGVNLEVCNTCDQRRLKWRFIGLQDKKNPLTINEIIDEIKKMIEENGNKEYLFCIKDKNESKLSTNFMNSYLANDILKKMVQTALSIELIENDNPILKKLNERIWYFKKNKVLSKDVEEFILEMDKMSLEIASYIGSERHTSEEVYEFPGLRKYADLMFELFSADDVDAEIKILSEECKRYLEVNNIKRRSWTTDEAMGYFTDAYLSKTQKVITEGKYINKVIKLLEWDGMNND